MTTATVRETLNLPGGVAPRKTRVRVRLVADDDVTVTAPGYVTAVDETVVGTRWATPDGTGRWSLAGVHPNSGSSDDVITSPVGSRYEIVVFFPDGTTSGPRYISVPDSAGPHEVQDILTAAPTSISSPAGLEDIDGSSQTLPRTAPLSDDVAITSGTLYLSYLEASGSDEVNQLQFVVGDTAAGATPSLVKFALFVVESDGSLTRVAVGSSAEILGDPATAQSMQVTALDLVSGSRYALGLLVITNAATPTMVGVQSVLPSSIVASEPALAHVVTGLADMPTTVAVGDLEATTKILWGQVYYLEIA